MIKIKAEEVFMKKVFFLKVTLFVFVFNCIFSGVVFLTSTEAAVSSLSKPISIEVLSEKHSLPVLKGLRLNPENPMKIEFIIEANNKKEVKKEEAEKLVRYFLTVLAMPIEDIWVNLSPYEQDRVINDFLAKTELGTVLLEQDYMLKQLSSGLTHPDTSLGKYYWKTVQGESTDNFNKIWITPDRSSVYQNQNIVVVTEASLKALTEQDYIAIQNNSLPQEDSSSSAIKEVIIPELETELNEGNTFAPLRQVHSAVILGTWFKQVHMESFFNSYLNKKKITGVDKADFQDKQKVYNSYLEAFKKGSYDFIKKEFDPVREKFVKKHYFSGGYFVGEKFKVETGAASAVSQKGECHIASVELLKLFPNNQKHDEQKTPYAHKNAASAIVAIVDKDPETYKERFTEDYTLLLAQSEVDLILNGLQAYLQSAQFVYNENNPRSRDVQEKHFKKTLGYIKEDIDSLQKEEIGIDVATEACEQLLHVVGSLEDYNKPDIIQKLKQINNYMVVAHNIAQDKKTINEKVKTIEAEFNNSPTSLDINLLINPALRIQALVLLGKQNSVDGTSTSPEAQEVVQKLKEVFRKGQQDLIKGVFSEAVDQESLGIEYEKRSTVEIIDQAIVSDEERFTADGRLVLSKAEEERIRSIYDRYAEEIGEKARSALDEILTKDHSLIYSMGGGVGKDPVMASKDTSTKTIEALIEIIEEIQRVISDTDTNSDYLQGLSSLLDIARKIEKIKKDIFSYLNKTDAMLNNWFGRINKENQTLEEVYAYHGLIMTPVLADEFRMLTGEYTDNLLVNGYQEEFVEGWKERIKGLYARDRSFCFASSSLKNGKKKSLLTHGGIKFIEEKSEQKVTSSSINTQDINLSGISGLSFGLLSLTKSEKPIKFLVEER